MTAKPIRMLRGRVVTPRGVIDDGVVGIGGGRIAHVRPAARTDRVATTAAWILPGFVDIHVHGGGGHSLATGDPDQAADVVAFHARHGTTTMLASLVAGPPELMHAATFALAPLVARGQIAGVHLEGPFLSPRRCGAQNPVYLREPDLTELNGLLESGVVAMVTIAPELPNALDAIRAVVDRGARAAVGHTDATYEQTLAAIDAGASVATHTGNAMPPVHHRNPGPIVALLHAPGVICELVVDGAHLHEGMLRHIVATVGPDRAALVTDATAAAGMPDGDYDLGEQAVTVAGGVARLTGDRATLAGSTLTMDAAIRRTVHSGIDIVAAAMMAATTPARVVGLDRELGAIAVGLSADLVLLDQELSVIEVIRRGGPA